MTLLSTAAAFAMAFGAPLVYADQAYNIQKKRNSEGFSKDVCAVLLIANVSRIYFWFGEKFEFALLLQSILMIAAQLFLLSLLIKFRPGSFASSSYSVGSQDRNNNQQDSDAYPPTVARTTPSRPVAEFSADDAFDGDHTTTSTTNQADKPTNSLFSGAGALFSGSAASQNGHYAPLFGLQMPIAPTLADDDEDHVADSSSAPVRLGRKTVRFFQAGLRLDREGKRRDGSSGNRIFGFWTWPDYSSYVLFLVILAVFLGVLQLLLGGLQTYIWLLGMFALGLESTLPVPQAVENQRRKSLSGFRVSVLLGWLIGDVYKTVYFLINKSPVQFIIAGFFALSVDLVICAQLHFFRDKTAADDEDLRASDAEALEAGRRTRAPIEDDGQPGTRAKLLAKSGTGKSTTDNSVSEPSHFQIEADDDDDDDEGDISRGR